MLAPVCTNVRTASASAGFGELDSGGLCCDCRAEAGLFSLTRLAATSTAHKTFF